MATASLTVDLNALCANWRALNALTSCETGAVVKANGYGTGAQAAAKALAQTGARRFFVAVAEEGVAVRQAIGPDLPIHVFGGHMEGDTALIRDYELTPMLNSAEQFTRHIEALPKAPFGLQLDTGMNRLGMEPAEWAALRETALPLRPALVMSHLACADEPDHPMNALQLQVFREMTDGIDAPRSLSATGGILLAQDYHFDVTRPGIGLYGGLPFGDAKAVVSLDLPVIQIRDVAPGESVGYGNSWIAERPTRVATVAAGYADGILRILSNNARLWAGETPCPVLGRVSMDLITVDVTDLDARPESLTLLNAEQTVDDLAEAAQTIGYEILTILGPRYARSYVGP